MKWYQSVILLLGRLGLCSIFLLAALGSLMNWSATVEFMRNAGIPMPNFMLIGALAFQIVGGFSVLIGYYARVGALLLLIFVLATAFTMHNYWAMAPEQQHDEMVQFMKNISIGGGLLMVIGFGSGPLSIDGIKRLP